MRRFGFLVLLPLLCSCAGIRSLALKTAAPLFKDAMSGLESESNWEGFRRGTPGNLTLIDGLLAVRPSDETLLMAAIKGNAGYAFGVLETLYLDDKLNDEEESFHKQQAIAYYSKAFSYGLQFLEANDLSFSDVERSIKDEKGIPGLLGNQLSNDESTLEAILFTAQSLASLINLQRERMLLVAKLPVAKGMFDWVCEEKPDIANGTCQIFYGSYEAGRPRMLGGNPDKGKEIFEEFILANPHNWLARVAFIQYYAIPQNNENAYRMQAKELERFISLQENKLNWMPGAKTPDAFKIKSLGLYQAIAIKRYKTIKKYEKDLF